MLICIAFQISIAFAGTALASFNAFSQDYRVTLQHCRRSLALSPTEARPALRSDEMYSTISSGSLINTRRPKIDPYVIALATSPFTLCNNWFWIIHYFFALTVILGLAALQDWTLHCSCSGSCKLSAALIAESSSQPTETSLLHPYIY